MPSHPFWRICTNGSAGVAALAIASLLGCAAHAASFDIVGAGQAYTLPSNFSPDWSSTPEGFNGSGPGTVIDIFYSADATSSTALTPMTFNTPTASGSGLGISGANGPVTLTYTYLGYLAAFTNQFSASSTSNGTAIFQNYSSAGMAATPNGASYTVTTTLPGSGLVPLLFNSAYYSGPNGTAVNGGPIGSDVALGFLIDPSNPNIAYAMFKDVWQNGDANFDNMVVEIQIGDPSATPLPAALPLFAIGLGIIGILGWRRNAAHRRSTSRST